MELVLVQIAALLEIIVNNFWPIFLILVMLRCRRMWGIILLVCQVTFGFKWIPFLIISAIAICDDDTYIDKIKVKIAKKNNKIETDTENDPDYQ